jgi:inosine triphosphate pyrophosphatase
VIYFVTGNKNKFEEAKKIIPELAQIDIDLVEIQDIDPKAVIEHKLKEAYKHKKGKFMVEDTSLFLDGMNGLPGTLTKWFIKSIDNDGIYKLSKIFGEKASAVTYIGYLVSPTEIQFFKGEIKGRIVKPRGELGFGWDCIFEPKGYKKTFGEMSITEKNKISMRKLAIESMRNSLITAHH